MDALQSVLGIVGLFLVRLGVPVLLTIGAIFLLRRLDEHWKQEAKGVDTSVAVVQTRNPGCWDIKNCSPELRASCKAYANQDKPCWQVYRRPDGSLREGCIDCGIFMNAPIPVAA